MFSFFKLERSPENLSQAIFIKKYNTIAQFLKTRSLDPDGICDELCSIYIRYSIKGKQKYFFNYIKQINTCSLITNSTISPLKDFFLEVSNTYFSSLLEDRPCHDSFAFLITKVLTNSFCSLLSFSDLSP